MEQARADPRDLKIQLVTDDPDVVIYWLVEDGSAPRPDPDATT